MRHRSGNHRREQRAVRLTAVVLTPCHLTGILMQVLPADPVMLAELGTAQTGEVAFRLIGACAVIQERYRVVHPARIVITVQTVP